MYIVIMYLIAATLALISATFALYILVRLGTGVGIVVTLLRVCLLLIICISVVCGLLYLVMSLNALNVF